jgi:hypothetical protein
MRKYKTNFDSPKKKRKKKLFLAFIVDIKKIPALNNGQNDRQFPESSD